MLPLDDVVTLALFAELVERRSVTAAASSAGISKSAISKRIAALENRVGVRLLERSSRGVTPTEEGLHVARDCAALVEAARSAHTRLCEAGQRPRGTLRVSASPAFADLHLASAIVDFLARYPDVDVHLFAEGRSVDLTGEGIDLAIRVSNLRAASSLVARKLTADRIVAVASPGYLRRHGTPRVWSDLRDHALLRHSLITPRFEGRRSPHHEPLVSNHAALVRAGAIRGVGVAMLPSFVVAPDVRARRLVTVLDRVRLPRTAIHAVFPQRRNLPLRTRVFVDFLAARFGAPEWRRKALIAEH